MIARLNGAYSIVDIMPRLHKRLESREHIVKYNIINPKGGKLEFEAGRLVEKETSKGKLH